MCKARAKARNNWTLLVIGSRDGPGYCQDQEWVGMAKVRTWSTCLWAWLGLRDWAWNTGGNSYTVRSSRRTVWPGFGPGLVVGGHVSG